MPRRINDPWRPGYAHAVWVGEEQDRDAVRSWLLRAELRGAWWQARTEVLFESLEDAVAFGMAWECRWQAGH